MTLDEAIRGALGEGATGITLWRSDTGWQANVRGPDGGWSIGIDTDPVAALRKALRPDPQPEPGGLFE